jgi:hypothetical protein
MRDDPTLQEDFELGGRFWLPQAPNEVLGGRSDPSVGPQRDRHMGVDGRH